MIKKFLKPLKIVFIICIISTLSLASDIAQLTNFNILVYLKANSPQSYYIMVIGILLLYFILVICEFVSNKPESRSQTSKSKPRQFIRTRNVNNSTIFQIMKDKED